MPKLGMRTIRRDQVCRAAAEVISTKGFDRATLREVAEKAGVSTGTVNHYFSNRLDLLVQTLAYVSDRFTGRIAQEVQAKVDGIDQLQAYILASLEQAHANATGWRVWIAAMSEATRSQRVAEVIQQRREALYHLLCDIFLRIRPDLHMDEKDALTVARELEGLVSGLGLSMITGEQDLELTESERTVLEFALSRLEAVGTSRETAKAAE
jgi:TetR/AcrR family transcriptional repressor of bet genes